MAALSRLVTKRSEITTATKNKNNNALRPSSLKINRRSQVIMKSTSSPPASPLQSSALTVESAGRPPPSPQPANRNPLIIYTRSPKIIHIDSSNFKALVQKLTGRCRSDNDDEESSNTSSSTIDNNSSNDSVNNYDLSRIKQESDDCHVNSCVINPPVPMFEPSFQHLPPLSNSFMRNVPGFRFYAPSPSNRTLFNYSTDSVLFSNHNMRYSLSSSSSVSSFTRFEEMDENNSIGRFLPPEY